MRLPNITLERGTCVIFTRPGYSSTPMLRRHFQLVGRLDCGTPFLLSYASGGVTQWQCQTRLEDGTRKKILSQVRKEIRTAAELPDYILVHDFRSHPDPYSLEVSQAIAAVYKEFFDHVWRAEYLNDRDSDYVDLAVPYAEKDIADKLGAQWDGARKVWKVRRQEDMSAFARWMPKESSPDDACGQSP